MRKMSDERKAVLRLFEEAAPEPLTPSQVAAATGKHAGAMRKLMYGMLSDGQLDAGPNRGEYVLPNLPTDTDFNFEVEDDVTANSGSVRGNVTDAGTDVTGDVTGPGIDEERSVSTAVRGGEMPANKPNSSSGMNVFYADPPNGEPGTYPTKRDEMGRLVPDFDSGSLS